MCHSQGPGSSQELSNLNAGLSQLFGVIRRTEIQEYEILNADA